MRGVRSLIVLLVIAIPLAWYAWHESKQPAGDDKKQDKVFAGLQADKIDRVSIKSESGDRTSLEKKSGAWQVTQPLTVKGDEAELSGVTSNLGSLEAQRVVDEQATDFKQYSLDPPRIEVTFSVDGKEQKLLLGQKTPTGSDLYARVPDKPRVFLVPAYLETTFNRTTFDLRDKTVLAFDRDKVDHVDLTSGGQTIALVKKDADWMITAPIDARADFSAIEGILGRINTTQMRKIVATEATDLKRYGLDDPAVTLRLGAGSNQATLLIGKPDADAVFAKDASRPLVFTVDTVVADELKKPVDDFRIKDLFDARSFNTTRVEVTRAGQLMTFERSGDKWKQITPSAKEADGGKVDALVSALTAVRATGFVDQGIDTPEVTFALKYEEGKKQERVSFAKRGEDSLAQRQGDRGAAKIDATAYDAVIKALDALK